MAKRLLAFSMLSLALLGASARTLACPATIAPVVEPVLAAVVKISTTQRLRGLEGAPLPRVPEGSPFERFFNEFLERGPGKRRQRRTSALGAGFVIDPSGLIVTNNHVLAEADEITVEFNDGSTLVVREVLGRDRKTDLALLKVAPTQPLRAVRFGDSSKMRVGDCVFAVGNPFGLGTSVTSGIISAKKRDISAGLYDEFLQTDAAINKGNSGGPLFNLRAEVIGVNTAILSPSGRSVGIGFAIPSNVVARVVDQLRNYGEVRRGWIGVQIQSVSEVIAKSLGLARAKGALVSRVSPNGPAARAGLKVGDVILKFDGQVIARMRDLARIVAWTKIGRRVAVEVLREGKRLTLALEVAALAKTKRKSKSRTTASAPDGDGGGSASEAERKNGSPTLLDKRRLLGLEIAALTPALRRSYGVRETVTGAVIVAVAPKSAAARKGIKPGEVIIEVAQEEVTAPGDVADRLEELREAGRKVVVLTLSSAGGDDIRSVSLPLEPRR